MFILFSPGLDCADFDYDEGVNLIKASLVANGNNLYQDIWSDQPPTFTVLLAQVFPWFGSNITFYRGIVLGFTIILLAALWHFICLIGSRAHAVVALVLLLISANFLKLSTAVMLGIPMLSMAMVSLLCLGYWHRTRKRSCLLGSAAFLAISITIKLQIGFLVPIWVIGIGIGELTHPRQRSILQKLSPVAVWMTCFVSSCLLLLMLGVDLEHFPKEVVDQLLGGHIKARDNYTNAGLETVANMSQVALLVLPIATSIWIGIQKKSWLILYPAFWLATILALLLFHSPVWFHHLLLIEIPAAMLCAYLAGEMWHTIRQSRFRPSPQLLGVGLVSLLLLVSTVRLGSNVIKTLRGWTSVCRNPSIDMDVLQDIKALTREESLIITDRPTYAILSGNQVPPNLAVLTQKRLKTGGVSEGELLRTIQSSQPPIIYLERFEWPLVNKALLNPESGYTLVREEGKNRLYRRNFAEIQ